jgi:hypothetical protein
VPTAEKELATQIGFLNGVIISDVNTATIAANAHHSKVLQEFATQSSGTNKEILELAKTGNDIKGKQQHRVIEYKIG